jgi:hypothetical protein
MWGSSRGVELDIASDMLISTDIIPVPGGLQNPIRILAFKISLDDLSHSYPAVRLYREASGGGTPCHSYVI